MNAAEKIGLMIAMTGLVATLVAPGAQTAGVLKAGFNGVSRWQKVAEGR